MTTDTKTEDNFTYDHRNKKLIRTRIDEHPVELDGKVIGSHKQRIDQEFDEEGIKGLLDYLKKQRADLATAFKDVNIQLEATKAIEDDEDIKKLSAQLQKLQELSKKEKAQSQRDMLLKNQQEVRTQYEGIANAIKDHLDINKL